MKTTKIGKLIQSRIGEFIPKLPKECEGKSFCPRILNLPKNLDALYNAHKDDIDKLFAEPITYYDEDFDERQGSAEEFALCESREYRVLSRSALKDYLGNVRLLIMSPNVTVTGRACTEEEGNMQCKNDFADIKAQNGYKTECKQMYMIRDLPVYIDEARYEVQKMRVPSCCECLITPD